MLTKSITDIAKEVLKIEADSINRLIERFNEDEFNKAIDLMYNCKGRVIVTGMGKSGLVGKKIAATLSSTGTPSYFLHPAESTHGDSGMVTRDDVIVAISNSGETQELMNLMNEKMAKFKDCKHRLLSKLLKFIELLKEYGFELFRKLGKTIENRSEEIARCSDLPDQTALLKVFIEK